MSRIKVNRRLVVFCISVFMTTFALGAFIGNHLQIGPFDRSIATKTEQGKKINVLFMGIDARDMETNSRSDTMILASIDSKTNKIAMVWIPRDTRVEVKRNHYDKINSVNYTQGPEAACKVVSKLLDIPVDHYVVTNFAGFAKIIDILGGVTLDVESNMFHNDPDPNLRINLTKGVQRLDGQNALRYVRYRGGPTADIGRTGRQQKFIKALAAEVLQGKTLLKLPELVPELAKNIHTNIPLTDMLAMVKLAKNFGSQEIYTQTLPGYSYTDRDTGASYWQADPEIAAGIIDDLFSGKEYDVAQDPPESIRQKPNIKIQPVVEENELAEETAGEEEEGTEGDTEGENSNPNETVGQPEQPDNTIPEEEATEPGNEPGDSSDNPALETEQPPVTPGEPENPPAEPDPGDNTGAEGY